MDDKTVETIRWVVRTEYPALHHPMALEEIIQRVKALEPPYYPPAATTAVARFLTRKVCGRMSPGDATYTAGAVRAMLPEALEREFGDDISDRWASLCDIIKAYDYLPLKYRELVDRSVNDYDSLTATEKDYVGRAIARMVKFLNGQLNSDD